jgi:hypothetical protein
MTKHTPEALANAALIARRTPRKIIIADTFADGFKRFTGGYWVEIHTPTEVTTVRPDGSLCLPIAKAEGKGA